MLTKEDIKRIENTTECFFNKGGLVGKHISKHTTNIARWIAVISGIAILGSVFFFIGMVGHKKDSLINS
jgi:hypothetical protein